MIVPPCPSTLDQVFYALEDCQLPDKPKPDWNQIDMVELYEDLSNGIEQGNLELDSETYEFLENRAHARGQSVSRYLHEVVVPYALKIIEERENAGNS